MAPRTGGALALRSRPNAGTVADGKRHRRPIPPAADRPPVKRRSYLSTLAGSAALAGSTVLAGCSTGFRPTDGLEVGHATVGRGETVAVPVEAAAALRLRVTDPQSAARPEEAHVESLFGEAEIDPEPARVWTVHPPTWEWRRPRRVTVRLPVRVTPDAPAGEYTLSARRTDGETTGTATGTLTVE